MFHRYTFHSVYVFLSTSFIGWVALYLQSGNSGAILFWLHDVISDANRYIFTLCFPGVFLATFLANIFLLKVPRLDSINRIIVVNILAYSFLGFGLSILRIPFYSREVFILGFVISSASLVIHYWLRHRLFPKIVGAFADTSIDFFEIQPNV